MARGLGTPEGIDRFDPRGLIRESYNIKAIHPPANAARSSSTGRSLTRWSFPRRSACRRCWITTARSTPPTTR